MGGKEKVIHIHPKMEFEITHDGVIMKSLLSLPPMPKKEAPPFTQTPDHVFLEKRVHEKETWYVVSDGIAVISK